MSDAVAPGGASALIAGAGALAALIAASRGTVVSGTAMVTTGIVVATSSVDAGNVGSWSKCGVARSCERAASLRKLM